MACKVVVYQDIELSLRIVGDRQAIVVEECERHQTANQFGYQRMWHAVEDFVTELGIREEFYSVQTETDTEEADPPLGLETMPVG